MISTKHKILEYSDYSIHYFTSGNPNKPCLICLHPAFADHNCFNLQINDLGKHYFTIAIDMMGHGLSQPKRSKDKLDKTPDHILQIMKKEQIKDAHFMGVSLGSLMAQYFAELHAKHCLSLTIVGGYDINIQDPEISKAQRTEGLKWFSKLLFSMESFRRYVADQSVYDKERKEGFHEMALKFTRRSLRYMSGLSKVVKQRNSDASHIPLLIIVGEFDRELAQQKAQEMFHSHKNASFQIIKNAGHCANMDNPIAFNTTLLNCLLQWD